MRHAVLGDPSFDRLGVDADLLAELVEREASLCDRRPVTDFQADQRPDGSRPQQRDKETGLPIWQCTVIDGDEDTGRKDIGVAVKFVAEVRPVPPKNTSPLPWTPVKFVGLTALPYVDDSGNRPRIAWSFRAESFANGDLAAMGGSDQKSAA